MRILLLSSAVLTVLSTVGCTTTGSTSARGGSCCGSVKKVTDADVPSGRSDEPDVALSPTGDLFGTWAVVNDGNGQSDVIFASYREENATWEQHVRLNSKPGSAVAGRQVGPRLVSTKEGYVVVSWGDRGRDPNGDVVVARSTDGGRSFTDPVRVNDDPTNEVGQEYHDIAISPDGTIWVAWLDERDAPESYVNQKQLYLACSRDGGQTFEKNRKLTTGARGVCPCCRPSLATSADGSIHVVFRDREGDHLFIRVLSKHAGEDEFSAPVTVSKPWKLPACPVNSPQIASDGNGTLWVLWVDESEGSAKLYWARSTDHARRFETTGRIEDLMGPEDAGASHLTLTARRGVNSRASEAIASWETTMGQICMARLPRDGSPEVVNSFVVAGDLESITRSPALASSSGYVGLCWVSDDATAPPHVDRFPWNGLPKPRFGAGGSAKLRSSYEGR